GDMAAVQTPVSRHPAGRKKITADAQPFWLEERGQFLTDGYRAILMKGAMIAEAVEIEFQRFRFDQPSIRDVINHERGEIRLTRDRAERGKFGKRKARHKIRARMRVAHAIEHRSSGGSRDWCRTAKLGRVGH